MERAEDTTILEKARQDERVCFTLDRDFHAHSLLPAKGVLLSCFYGSKD